MLYEDFILKLLDLQEISIINIQETKDSFFVYCNSTKPKPVGYNIHDYRVYKIKFGKFRNRIMHIFNKENLSVA